ncbi:hypothetical protein LXA43DRAFT_1063149 [Ganoderma leucocontextum]|nr:hypothetical protein LXA43DRAFT_1063149 [Ganoderma leucocontextum]
MSDSDEYQEYDPYCDPYHGAQPRDYPYPDYDSPDITSEPDSNEPETVSASALGRHASLHREAASRAVAMTSTLYATGGALDSQTGETQFVDGLYCGKETHNGDGSPAKGGPPSTTVVGLSDAGEPVAMLAPPPIPSSGITRPMVHERELARTRVELARVRQQLYEYVGRWIQADARVQVLEVDIRGLEIEVADPITRTDMCYRAPSDS